MKPLEATASGTAFRQASDPHAETEIVTSNGVRTTRGTEGRDRKARRWPKSPADVHGDKIAKERIPSERDRLGRKRELARARLRNRECTWAWADSIWYGHDYCYAVGRLVGSGDAKVECPRCLRWYPPYNFVGRKCEDCDHGDKAPPHREPRVNLDDRAPEGTPVILIEPGQLITSAVASHYMVKVVPEELPQGGVADPGELDLSDDMTAAEQAIARDQHAREVAAFDADEQDVAAALAKFNARMSSDPKRADDWMREWKRATGTASQRAKQRRELRS